MPKSGHELAWSAGPYHTFQAPFHGPQVGLRRTVLPGAKLPGEKAVNILLHKPLQISSKDDDCLDWARLSKQY